MRSTLGDQEWFPHYQRLSISSEDRYYRESVRSSGFSTPVPMVLESWRRKWTREAVNSSQRMNHWLSPNRRLMRSPWRTVGMMDVSPIPPAPVRAIGVRYRGEQTIFPINLSRPKETLGYGGGSSPGALDGNARRWISQQSGLLTCFETRRRSV